TGAYRWAKAFGGTGWDRLGDLGIDSKGNLYLTGYFPGTIDFGGGTLTSAGHSEIFLASFTSSGAHRWSKRFGGDRYDQAYALTVDGTDNVTICGAFQRTVSFGGASLSSAYYARYDAFLASFTSSGTHRWSKRFGESAAHEFGKHVVATAGGDVIMAGLFQHAVDFGGGALTSAGGYDIVLAGYTSSGNYRWSKRFGGAQSEGVSGLTVDTTGRAYLTGSFHDPLDLGGGMLKSAGSDDIYLASYTSKGAHRWSKRMGGVPGDYGNALAIDATGDVIITGRFGSLLDLGGGLSLKSFGANDVYVAAFSEAGVPRWARHLGGTSWDSAAAIAAGPQGALVLTGFFEKSADFGGGPMSSAGLQDIFVTRWVE
ncbi:MAG: hypothetical protein KAI47_17975, partial [Deltaproteobacteria bacterium]|nr:hypothetical protein [Deltaproteobacteria bacterium]